MKKLKYIFLLILSLSCLFSFFGCSGTNARLINGSLNCDIRYSPYSDYISADSSFELYLPKKETYDISYTLRLYYEGNEIAKKEVKIRKNSNGGNSKISDYWHLNSYEFSGTVVSESSLEIRVTDIKATVKKTLTQYKGFSIGFGILGGAALATVIALFVVFNKKDGKAEN